MFKTEKIIFEGDSELGHYQVIDLSYNGRDARVLFSGKRAAAQSGIPRDGNPSMLFDYSRRFLELSLSLAPNNVLLIGGGAFTLPMEILKNLPNAEIDVVEKDPELEKIAKRYFGLKDNPKLKIILGDGREYLRSTKNTYDLILIDAFMHNIIPHPLSTKEFMEIMQRRLTKNGVVASNIISAYHGLHDSVIKQQYATYKSMFKHVDIIPADKVLSYWISQNFLLISTNKRFKPKYNLRFESLKPPLVNSSDVQFDHKNT
jgi:spermidine synthase